MKKIEAQTVKPMDMVRLKANRQYVRVNHVSVDGSILTVITRDIKTLQVRHTEVEFDTRPPETRGTWE